jgi:ABC-type protease/lipase transport system fused ATPase/permease subunit
VKEWASSARSAPARQRSGRLLTKLYEPQGGAILIGGVDIRQYHPHEIRRVVGLLGQEPDLFHGTVRSNILMANPRATDDQLIAAARMAGVDEFVKRHPSGYEMMVSERGQSLSGGQRQSIALARLLISQPRIVYLDEPSSAMDIASERVMIEQLKRSIQPDQTLIVSTHRHSMLDLVDRLIVISNGKLIGDGPKEQVLDSMRKNAAPEGLTASALAQRFRSRLVDGLHQIIEHGFLAGENIDGCHHARNDGQGFLSLLQLRAEGFDSHQIEAFARRLVIDAVGGNQLNLALKPAID